MNRVFSFGSYPSRSMRTGSRCTTLMKLPVAFSAGSNASVDPVPIVNPDTRPLNTCRPPYMSTNKSLLGYSPRRQQFLRAAKVELREVECGFAFFKGSNAGLQHGDPVVDVLNGVLQFPA